MASYLTLMLDTTEPDIELLLPSYTTQQSNTEITIIANETLAESGHDIYIIDSRGIRTDLTLTYNGNELVGLIDFGSFPMGMATVYARVLDEVHNLSGIVSKSIRVMNSEFMKVSINHEKYGNVDINHEEAYQVD